MAFATEYLKKNNRPKVANVLIMHSFGGQVFEQKFGAYLHENFLMAANIIR